MKKLLLFFATLLGASSLMAQNVQLHYDLGEDRNYLTSTVEMFKPDQWGNTFFFIDMDYSVGDNKGVNLGYFEIARCLKFWDAPLSVHVEYNGGMVPNFVFSNAWLSGIDYSWNNSDFTKGLSAKVLYKRIEYTDYLSYQTTLVWYMHFFDKKLSFTGFADFWKEKKSWGTGADIEKTDYVFLAEPQLWYNFTENISLGGEVELSNNFFSNDGMKIMPTVAAKWTF